MVAYLGGEPIRWADLQESLLEAAGGEVLTDLVLDRLIQGELARRGLTITPAMAAHEREVLTQSLNDDQPRAEQLLADLRRRRGLGDARFNRLLQRNAALRLLVQDEVAVSDAAVDQAYQLRYGPRVEARLIVTDSFQRAADLVHRAREGESFIDLAIAHSTDSSRAQGGLISPFSLADPSMPKAVRTALSALDPGEVSDTVALDDGFAVLRLERVTEPLPVAMEDVRDELTQAVRLRVEQMLMQRQVRAMLSEVDLVILDPILDSSWRRHHRQSLNTPK